MQKKNIEGDISSVRDSHLRIMEEYLDKTFDVGSFLPSDVVDMMCSMTCLLKREIAVYMDRKNRVLQIAVGDAVSVSSPVIDTGRSSKRLSGVKLLHTHPDGGVTPSDIDISSLRRERLDAMVVIGVRAHEQDEQQGGQSAYGVVTGASASILQRGRDGSLYDVVCVGPYTRNHFDRFDEIYSIIEQTDRDNISETTHTNAGEREKALLVGVTSEDSASAALLEELGELARTAGAEVVGYVTQKRSVPDAKYYVGSGIAHDLADKAHEKGAELIIFDDELSPSQIRNLENITNVRVIDRTALILDIFAARACTKEGRLQVELAQQKYRLPRLTGRGVEMSRLGGGIGTRGPGETKLESDKRHIYRKIHSLESQLREVSTRRDVLRRERKKRSASVIAVVGYTNAGKSTLVNSMCDSDVFVEDELFATLDTSVRRVSKTASDRDMLLVDTVGFIRKLPHDLIEAFKSTLEEAVYADLLLHVVDVSKPDYEECIAVVEKILDDIGAGARPRYLVLNKIDMLPEDVEINLSPTIKRSYGRILKVSAAHGEGLERLRCEIDEYFTRIYRRCRFLIPYSEGALLASLHAQGEIESEECIEEGTVVAGAFPDEICGRASRFLM